MKTRVAFVCWGNICRSTLSESVFTYKVKEKGLSDQFVIDSFATSTEEIGNPPHRGTVNKLKEVGIPLVPHRAKQITFSDYDNFDYIIGMDSINIKYLNRMLKGDPDGKVSKLLDYTLRKGADIARMRRFIGLYFRAKIIEGADFAPSYLFHFYLISNPNL